MKKFFTLLGLTLMAIPIFLIAQNSYLNHSYQSVTLPISAEILQDKFGKPDEIEPDDKDKAVQNWTYHMPSFVGEGYVFVIKNNVAIEKYHLISP